MPRPGPGGFTGGGGGGVPGSGRGGGGRPTKEAPTKDRAPSTTRRFSGMQGGLEERGRRAAVKETARIKGNSKFTKSALQTALAFGLSPLVGAVVAKKNWDTLSAGWTQGTTTLSPPTQGGGGDSGRGEGGGSGAGGGIPVTPLPSPILPPLTPKPPETIQDALRATEAKGQGYLEQGLQDSLGVSQQGREAVEQGYQDSQATLGGTLGRANEADEEIASMLGLGDRQFNLANLQQTPGYQFQFNQGNRALQNSAVGTALSGQNARNTIEYGQGFASNYFGKRLGQLGILSALGEGAREQSVGASTNYGNKTGDLSALQGALYQDTAGRQADLTTDLGSTLANLEIAELTGRSNANIAGQDRKENRRNFYRELVGSIVLKWW